MSKMGLFFEQTILSGVIIIISMYILTMFFGSSAIAGMDDTSKDWLNRSIEFYISGNYDLALLAIDKSIKLDPNNAISINNKGIILNKLGRYYEALEFFNKAIMIDPIDPNPWYNRGITQEKLSQLREAADSYTTATLLNPRNEDAWNRKGIVLRNLGRYAEAIQAYDKIIEQHPGSSSAWINKGIALSYSGRFTEALISFYKVIEMNPENREDLAKAWMYIGLDYLLEKRPENALDSFEHAIEKGNDYDWIWTAWFCKGIALKSMGRDAESRHALDICKKIRIKGNSWGALTYGISEYLNRIRNCYSLLVSFDQHHLLSIGT